ncbi:hypothetical protein [Xanthomonas fragariae]|uniref:hypothetical protein n=1 Tax=Xanthomonas fragariae TaxID=48664 RepID=UPI00131F1EA9|nr:hypothetical protein [Xanthomonas fragariae]
MSLAECNAADETPRQTGERQQRRSAAPRSPLSLNASRSGMAALQEFFNWLNIL